MSKKELKKEFTMPFTYWCAVDNDFGKFKFKQLDADHTNIFIFKMDIDDKKFDIYHPEYFCWRFHYIVESMEMNVMHLLCENRFHMRERINIDHLYDNHPNDRRYNNSPYIRFREFTQDNYDYIYRISYVESLTPSRSGIYTYKWTVEVNSILNKKDSEL